MDDVVIFPNPSPLPKTTTKKQQKNNNNKKTNNKNNDKKTLYLTIIHDLSDLSVYLYVYMYVCYLFLDAWTNHPEIFRDCS